jgi:hypothetical protein
MVSAADRDLRRRSAWRVLLPALVLALVIVAAVGTRIAYGQPGPDALVLSGGVGLIALWAVVDGGRRALGHSTYLGTGRGLDRLFGAGQVLMSIGMAIALLPNAVGLLELAARMAVG